MKKYVFACVHNGGRSQIAGAWFELLADPAKAFAVSAGTNPGPAVLPEVVTVMREVGAELAHVSPRHLTSGLAADATLLITMGCGEACPSVPGLRVADWPMEDPKGKSVEVVRRIRDQIGARVAQLVAEEGVGKQT